MTRASLTALALAGALLLASCGGSSGPLTPDPEATCDSAQTRDVVYTKGGVVHAARADGGGDVVLSRGLDVDGGPVITYTGCVVAFLADQGDTVGLWLAAADGSSRRRLYTAGQMARGDIAFAPDGDAIAAIFGGRKIRTIDTETGESEPLGLAGDYAITSLSWSPAEDSIAFTGQPEDEIAAGARITPDPYLVDAGGGYATQLADTPGVAEYTVDYSYDNRKLAIGGDAGLQVLYLSGGEIRTIDPDTGPFTGASWLPDSSALVYAKGPAIVAHQLPSGPTRTLLGPAPGLADPQWTLQGNFP